MIKFINQSKIDITKSVFQSTISLYYCNQQAFNHLCKNQYWVRHQNQGWIKTIDFSQIDAYVDKDQLDTLSQTKIWQINMIQLIHLLKMVFSYLNGVELVQAKQTCQYFNLLIRLQRYKEEQNKTEIVMDNGIQKYMEVGLEKIRDWNLVALQVVVSSKDQGYATASYSSSWVTLKLIKPENDNLNHGRDSQNFDEVMIIENYRVKKFKNHTIIITPFENKNDKLTKFFNHIKGGNYVKLAIVMKCYYPGWVCQIQYASVEFVILEKD